MLYFISRWDIGEFRAFGYPTARCWGLKRLEPDLGAIFDRTTMSNDSRAFFWLGHVTLRLIT